MAARSGGLDTYAGASIYASSHSIKADHAAPALASLIAYKRKAVPGSTRIPSPVPAAHEVEKGLKVVKGDTEGKLGGVPYEVSTSAVATAAGLVMPTGWDAPGPAAVPKVDGLVTTGLDTVVAMPGCVSTPAYHDTTRTVGPPTAAFSCSARGERAWPLPRKRATEAGPKFR